MWYHTNPLDSSYIPLLFFQSGSALCNAPTLKRIGFQSNEQINERSSSKGLQQAHVFIRRRRPAEF